MSEERSSEASLRSSKLARAAERLEAIDTQPDGSAPVAKSDLARLVRLSEQYEGPFPHPDLLRKLDTVVQNGAERAFAMAETEQSHRHDLERKMVNAEARDLDRMGIDRRIVIIGGFGLVLAGLVMSFVAALRGNYLVSGVTGVATVVGAVVGALRITRQSGKSTQ